MAIDNLFIGTPPKGANASAPTWGIDRSTGAVWTTQVNSVGTAAWVLATSESLAIPFVAQTTGYTMKTTDRSIYVTGAANATITLPVAGLYYGQKMAVANKLTNAANVTVNAVGGAAIGNSGNDTSEVVWTYGSISTFQWDGTQWWVVSH